jgi:hypothetical protein
MRGKIFLVPGALAGTEQRFYQPLIDVIKSSYGDWPVENLRAGEDWNPAEFASQIRKDDAEKKVLICISLGSLVGNILANDEDTDVYYVCPYLGVDSVRRNSAVSIFRGVINVLMSIIMFISKPFKKHRFWPLFGGTKPDGWFLSIYAIARQYKAASTNAGITKNKVDGVVYSLGDKIVDPDIAASLTNYAAGAMRGSGDYPKHANFRPDKVGRFLLRAFSKKPLSNYSSDGEAYRKAFSSVVSASLNNKARSTL